MISFEVNRTLLSESQIEALQWSEHAFDKITCLIQNTGISDYLERPPSATFFTHLSPLDYNVFSTILYNSFAARQNSERTIMPYPSGGAIYSGQIIVFIKNVSNIEQGAYHYLPITSKLEKLNSLPIDIVEKSLFMNFSPEFINYDFFIFYGSIISKHICKYGHRGYRLGVMEIGSMYRNMELHVTNLHLQSRVWGGFKDESLTVSLGVDPRVIMPMICQLIGRSTC